MANEDKKQELLLTQEILENQRDITRETEMSYGVLKKNQMARKEVVDLTREVSKFAEEELAFANESNNSLRSKSELLTAQAKNQQLIAKGKILENDLTSKVGGQLEKLSRKDRRRLKVLQNQNATNESIAASIDQQIKARQKLNDELGIADNILRGLKDIPFIGGFIETEAVLKKMEQSLIKTGDANKALAAGAKEIKNQLKGAAKMAAFIGGLKIAAGIVKFMVFAATKMDTLVTNIGNELGVSVEASMKIQEELGQAAVNSGLAYVNAENMNKALLETSKINKINAKIFGEGYLVNFITLTERMGLGNKEAERLAFLQRLQGKNVRGVLNDQVNIVNQFNKQNKLAFNAKAIIGDVGNVSAEVAVALGMGTDELTKAALQAAALGTNLDTVSGIADGLLNFESSIQAELELSLATNQRISLAKERQLALDNKLGELAESLMKQEPILKAFREGNRIQMELAAQAMNVSKEQLAEMIMMEDKRLLTNEEFVEIYGQQKLDQIEALSAAEELQKTIEKMKLDLAMAFLPLVPAVKSMMQFLTAILESKTAMGVILSIMTGMAVRSITIAVATAYQAAFSPTNPANIASLGLAGLAIGSLLAGTIYGVSQMSKGSIEEVDGQDVDVRGIKINTLPMDSIEIDKGANRIAVGTNLQGQNMDEVKGVLKNIEELLRNPVGQINTIEYDAFAKNASNQDIKYKSSFV